MNLPLTKRLKVSLFSLCVTASALAQTDVDGIMMGRKNLCSGVLFGRSAWTHYWEGTFYRDNKNLGTVSATSAMAMANYGITDKLNIIAGLPWIRTKASAGTMIGREGFQDLSVAAKYKFYTRTIGAVDVSGIGIIGGSVPVTNYVADYLPLAIGMHSKNAMARLMADAEWKHFFGTISGTYMVRSNVKIDRNSYYTNEMHYTNLVAMPDVWMWNARLGYRKGDLILEAVFDRMNTQGGFDIRKNDMPFPSNNMEATRLGLNAKIPVPKTNGLSLILNGMQTVAGRNMGKSSSWMFGFFYLADVSKKTKGGIK